MLTVPNVISFLRLLCIPLFVWLIFERRARASAATLLAVLGATDWIDGYIARRFQQVSRLGKILDPTADRLLLGVGVAALLVDGAVPWWVGALVIVRELTVSLTTVGLAAAGAARIDVQWVGKAATFGLLCAFPLFLWGVSDVSWRQQARLLAWLWVVPSLALSYYAALRYVPLARRALTAGRAGRGSGHLGERIG